MLKNCILILVLTGVYYSCFSQSSVDKIELYNMDSSTIEFKIDTLTKEQFSKFTANLTQERTDYNLKNHIDSLKQFLPKTVKETDSCLIIGNGNKELKICQKHGQDEKASELYKLLDYKCGYLIVLNGGYEWWRYILIDTETGEYFILRDAPIFIDCSYAYSFGNYYMEGQFTLHDLINKQKLEFDSYNWRMVKCYRAENDNYFEFKSEKDNSTTQYLHIQFD